MANYKINLNQMKFDIMWNIENPFQFMKQAREEYYTDD